MSRTQLDYLLVFLVNITLPIFFAWECYSGNVSASVAWVVGLASVVIANGALFAGLTLRLKREVKKLSGRIIAFGLLLGIAASCAMTVGVRLIPAQDDFTQLAYSNKPLTEIRPEPKRLFVKLLRRREQLSTDYAHLAASVKPISPPLYSAESFASPATSRSTVAAMKQAATADFAYFDQRQQAIAEFRDQVTRIDPNSEYLRAWEDTVKREESRAALEKNWVSSVMALYEYAAAHSGSMRLKDGRLVFSNADERADFVKQLQASKALSATFQSNMQKSIADQKRAGAAAGIDK